MPLHLYRISPNAPQRVGFRRLSIDTARPNYAGSYLPLVTGRLGSGAGLGFFPVELAGFFMMLSAFHSANMKKGIDFLR